MRERILEVLERYSVGQTNLGSLSARKRIAEDIVTELEKPSEAQKRVDFDNDKSKWIGEYCGGNTWDVYNDYMGTGTNHLKCELEVEIKQRKEK